MMSPATPVRIFLPVLLCLVLSSCISLAERQRLASTYVDLGNVFAEKEQWDKAGDAWSRALELDPAQRVAAFNLLRALTEAGRYEQAIKQADQLLEFDPENMLVKTAKAYALHRAGRTGEALALYREVVSLRAEDLVSTSNLAVLLEGAGQAEEAIAVYSSLLERQPDHSESHYRLGVLLTGQGDYEKALVQLEAYLSVKKDSNTALYAKSQALEGLREYGKAVEVLRDLLARAPNLARARFDLARLRLTVVGEGEAGLSDLQAALAAGFNDQAALESLLASSDLARRDEVSALLEAVIKTPGGSND